MPAYVVVDIEIHDPVRYEEYRRVAAIRQASAHTDMVVVAGHAG